MTKKKSKKNKKDIFFPGPSIKIPIQEYITENYPCPKNWLAKLLWKFLKIEIRARQIENPIWGSLNKKMDLYSKLPKVSKKKLSGWNKAMNNKMKIAKSEDYFD